MKQETVEKFISNVENCIASGLTRTAYCKENKMGHSYFSRTLRTILNAYKSGKLDETTFSKVTDVASKLGVSNILSEKDSYTQQLDSEDKTETSYERDENGKIKYYCYKIYIRNRQPLIGKLSREEMNSIYRLYSYYGANLTQRQISRQFPDLSLIDFKRILRAFNITKANGCFPPHMLEECDEFILRDLMSREKENNLLRKAEEDRYKDNEKLLKKYVAENLDLKNQINDLSNFNINVDESIKPTTYNVSISGDNILVLHLSDIHLGSYTVSGSLYPENDNYGFEEAKRRLEEAIKRIISLGNQYNKIIVNLLGDNMDSCGKTGFTARLDHLMPTNADSRKQGNDFIKLLDWFIGELLENSLTNTIEIYSVPSGNHDGCIGYFATKAALAYLNIKYPMNVHTTLFEQFFGYYKLNDYLVLINHGKDSEFMKSGLPLNLNDKTKVMLYEWLQEHNLQTSKVLVIKGDLHTDNINSCKSISYRNVLSLYGSSDYSQMNFPRGTYGLSYELLTNNNLLRGTFENL